MIKAEAMRLGFLACGISQARFLDEEAQRLENWLNQQHHGQMHYMERNFDKRLDPRRLVDGAQSVVSVLFNYYTPQKQTDPEAPVISKHAYGKDYHFLVKDKLRQLLAFIQREIGDTEGRVFVDSAPVLERAWAVNSGLGWIGKNAMLLNRQAGSFFFIGQLVLTLPLATDAPLGKNYCGKCTRCMDACPTGAIVAPRVVDSRRCISYLTIETKDRNFSPQQKAMLNNHIFGCDICQNVCPWNSKATPHNESWFEPHPHLLQLSRAEWLDLEQRQFSEFFSKSAVKRVKWKNFRQMLGMMKKGEREF